MCLRPISTSITAYKDHYLPTYPPVLLSGQFGGHKVSADGARCTPSRATFLLLPEMDPTAAVRKGKAVVGDGEKQKEVGRLQEGVDLAAMAYARSYCL